MYEVNYVVVSNTLKDMEMFVKGNSTIKEQVNRITKKLKQKT